MLPPATLFEWIIFSKFNYTAWLVDQTLSASSQDFGPIRRLKTHLGCSPFFYLLKTFTLTLLVAVAIWLLILSK